MDPRSGDIDGVRNLLVQLFGKLIVDLLLAAFVLHLQGAETVFILQMLFGKVAHEAAFPGQKGIHLAQVF